MVLAFRLFQPGNVPRYERYHTENEKLGVPARPHREADHTPAGRVSHSDTGADIGIRYRDRGELQGLDGQVPLVWLRVPSHSERHRGYRRGSRRAKGEKYLVTNSPLSDRGRTSPYFDCHKTLRAPIKS